LRLPADVLLRTLSLQVLSVDHSPMELAELMQTGRSTREDVYVRAKIQKTLSVVNIA
jgi:hypothetical protein